jgi:hypothetical protein
LIVVAEIAYQHARLVLAPLLFREVDEIRYGGLHDLPVVGLNGDIFVVVRSRRAIKENDRDVGGVGRPNRRDRGVVVGRDEDNSIDLALDHRLKLVVLFVLVAV